MDRLWAPWRMASIDAARPDGCIFCLFPARTGDAADRENLIVHRASRCFTMLNRYPYNSGHVMVVPRAHLARLDDLLPEDFADLQDELRRVLAVLRAVYRPDGLNVGMNLGVVAGAGIADHLHWHVVPHWNGDTSFMTTVSETRTIPQMLAETYARLAAALI